MLHRYAGPLGVGLVAALGLCTIWVSLWDHPIAPGSEGRYAAVSLAMQRDGNWLVPQLDGRPHLTKPPLTYWLQVVGLRVTGGTELGVRLPSALAASFTLIALLAFAWRLYGRDVGLIASALLSLMPLHVMVSRLGLTDALLGLFWFGTLAAGCLAIVEQRRRWLLWMWACVALGMLTKGHLSLLPVGVLLAWRLPADGLCGALRRLGVWVGLPCAVAPLALWAAAIIMHYPQAGHIWYDQTVHRATGSGAHTQPIWFFIPIFIVGLYPGTAMLNLPWFNFPARRYWSILRSGDAAALWGLAVILPLLVFSLNAGKLMSYLLPLAAPLALMVAVTIARWLRGEHDKAEPGVRPPDVRVTLLVSLLVLTIGVLLLVFATLSAVYLWVLTSLVLACVAGGWLCWCWRRRPKLRVWGLAAVWVMLLASWIVFFEVEDVVQGTRGNLALITAVRVHTRLAHPRIVPYGYQDASMGVYSGDLTPPPLNARQLSECLDAEGSNLVIVADARDWQHLAAREPALSGRFRLLMTWQGLPLSAPRYVLRGMAAPRPAP